MCIFLSHALVRVCAGRFLDAMVLLLGYLVFFILFLTLLSSTSTSRIGDCQLCFLRIGSVRSSPRRGSAGQLGARNIDKVPLHSVNLLEVDSSQGWGIQCGYTSVYVCRDRVCVFQRAAEFPGKDEGRSTKV
jgi:hypothetical protein